MKMSFHFNNFYLRRKLKDKLIAWWMNFGLAIVIILPVAIGFCLFLKSHLIFENTSITGIIFSKEWKPLSGKFGLLPFIMGSLWVTFLAVVIAVPVCLLSAIHLTQYAKKWVLQLMHPVIDILAGIPSVIYGIWGVIAIIPFVQNLAAFFGKSVSGYSILAGAIVLSIMIVPFILNIMVEIFRTVPEELTEASLSLGASRWQTIKKVIIRKAFPGIISAIGLGVSRAFGETIAVLMVVGNVIKIPHGIFQPGYPLPALIANNYGEMLSIPMYDSALMFSAFILFCVVVLFNLLSRMAIMRFERKL
jgi:phosphate ABC transporter, permease protein PstC